VPAAEITLIGLPWAKAFVERFPSDLDGLLILPGYPGFPEQDPQPKRLPAFFEQVRARSFDLAMQMQGSGEISNELAMAFGARRTVGFAPALGPNPDPSSFLPYPDDVAEPRRHLQLMAHLGAPPRGEWLEFPVYAGDRSELRAITGAAALEPQRYVCIHPGARAITRRWTPSQFAAIADSLAGGGLRVVLTGSEDELPVVAAVRDAMRTIPLDLAGRTTLGAMAALLQDARLLVSNDTGVSHLADALSVPSVVIYARSQLNRWAPLNRSLHRAVVRSGDEASDLATAMFQSEQLLASTTSLSEVRETAMVTHW
jgi:ADP-heptose:LPS heptosyltransferase